MELQQRIRATDGFFFIQYKEILEGKIGYSGLSKHTAEVNIPISETGKTR